MISHAWNQHPTRKKPPFEDFLRPLIEEIQEIKIHYNTWLVHIIYWLHHLYLSKVSWFLSHLTPKSFLFQRKFLGQMREFSPVNHSILLMEEILHQLIWQISHHFQGFIDVGWCRISSINSITTSESLREKFYIATLGQVTERAPTKVTGSAGGMGAGGSEVVWWCSS